jgi:hypothetical protein
LSVFQIQTHGTKDHDHKTLNQEAFTESLLNTQYDLSTVHMFFQVQLSMLTETFDSQMQTLNEQVLPYLAKGVDDYNDMRRETETALGGAHITCMAKWDRAQMQYGREVSSCASYPQYEIQLMLLVHNLYSWVAELYSNPVQMYGLQALYRYYPLTDDYQSIIMEINQQLGRSLNRFLVEDYEALSDWENYVFDYFDDISYNSYFCMYSLIGRFASATNRIISEAADGPCV